MALLILFGFLAGAGTALSPCVLPVLPIVLAAGATGGRRRPLGILVGLTASFTFATVALVYVLSALGLPDTLLRTLAIVVLLAFGAILLVPPLSARVEGWLSRVAGRVSAAGSGGAGASRSAAGGGAAGESGGAGGARRGDGFGSGLLVGASLGLVYAPCAGPVLAGVITVSAAQPFTAGRLAVALAYGLGSALVLYALMLGGRRLTAPLARSSGKLQIAMGAVMVVFALAMLNDYDLRFQSAIAKDLPAFLVNPTGGLEKTRAASDALADVRGGEGGIAAAALRAQDRPQAPGESGAGGDDDGKDDGTSGAGSGSNATHAAAEARLDLPVIGDAPDFVGTQKWFNTPGGEPLSLAGLRGRVVLVDFWTYSCINCLRTLPYLEAWDARYRSDGLTIVGVHTPEFPFEKDPGNVADAIAREGIRYPVVQDNDTATWTAYGNQYWPAEYFIDEKGRVRYAHFGEGDYGRKEEVIRTLLAEAGRDVGSARVRAHGITASRQVTTPESYLGAARAGEGFMNGAILPGQHDYGRSKPPSPDQLAYSGEWKISEENATAEGGSLDLNFGARRVYLVLGSPGGSRRMRVLLDGRPLTARFAGSDVHDGVVTVTGQRLYELVDLPQAGRHLLRLEPDRGVDAYAFTFG
ncbi:cytochrome c biogenesis protein DipZ [Conexibacter sp. CPCC 206217]|uniref:cytochrome c biogenesis protein DipZ n=1 Tax=Conexibacter sp. CPCC 206217 TaxID=3064574 RepID=UPI002716DEA1|nr:cytochrome c biogenesis protein DipZ [Conexibacter sp. CPCC 206217]MDO8213456.1 cytochrome c biogenesis protein DipZ [Conexibacter sp. CPCC 206217]